MFSKYDFRKYDYISPVLIIALFIISYYAIGSATRVNLEEGDGSLAVKQLYGFIGGFVIMLILSMIDYHIIGKLIIPIYILNIALLLAVFVIGVNVNNATRWIPIGSFTIQPSEIAKFFMVIVLAKYFDKFQSRINNIFVLAFSFILILIPVYLINAQPDLSTSLVLVFLFVVMVFGAGISYRYIFAIAIIAVPLTIGLLAYIQTDDQVLLENYQKERILAMINPAEYEKTTALQTQKSVQAIGSGQLQGKGLYNGKLNQYNYLPESETDFIFAIIGEEFGFIGCSVVLILLLLLMKHIFGL